MSMSRTGSLTMVLALVALLAACDRKPPPPSPPAPQVAVIKLFDDGALSRQDLDTAIAKEAGEAGGVPQSP